MARGIREAVADQLRVKQEDMNASISAGWIEADAITSTELQAVKFGTVAVDVAAIDAGCLYETIIVTTGVAVNDLVFCQWQASPNNTFTVNVNTATAGANQITLGLLNGSDAASGIETEVELAWAKFE